jgi:gliding motility-associated-like protein
VEPVQGVQYIWSGPNGFTATGDSIAIGFNVSGFGSFSVKGIQAGCTGNPVALDLIPKVVPEVNVVFDPQACKGQFKDASAEATPGAFLLWSNLSSGPQSRFSVGRHWVTATLNGCTGSDTFLIQNSGPTASFTTDPDDSLQVYKRIGFQDQSVAGLSPLAAWRWDLGYTTISTERNPSKVYNIESSVDVQLIVQDGAGCSDTITKTIEIGPPIGWFIPNLMTPDGNEENDEFFINDLEKYPGTSVKILDRWGRMIKEFADYKNEWKADGLQNGVYYYIIQRSDGEKFTGFIERKGKMD